MGNIINRFYRVPYLSPLSNEKGKIFFRYFKILYTAALRYGTILNGYGKKDDLEILFSGEDAPEVDETAKSKGKKHNPSTFAMKGSINLSGKNFDETILVEGRNSKTPYIVTFYPFSLKKDAELNETEPLVRAALDGVVVPLETVVEKMYPIFKKNPSMSPVDLMADIYNKVTTGKYFEKLENEIKIIKEKNKELEKTLKFSTYHSEKVTEENIKLKNINEELSNKLGIALKEIEEYKSDQIKSRAKGENLILDIAKVLIKVDKFQKGPSMCTRLTFEDGSEKFMKISTFDKDLSITKKAERLVNQLVKTSAWDPINEPGKWSSKGYFRNVYSIKTDI